MRMKWKKNIGCLMLVFILLVTWMVQSSAQTGTWQMEVVVTEGDGQVSLSWQEAEDDPHVQTKVSGAGNTLYVAKGVGQAMVEGLTNGVRYAFRLSRLDSDGVILAETIVYGTPRDETPPLPVSEAVGIGGEGGVLLRWTDPSCADLHKIRVTGLSGIVEVDKGVEQVWVGGLVNGSVYTFTLVAMDTSDNQSDAVQVEAVPEAGARIQVSGPGTVKGEQTFWVYLEVFSSRDDVFAVESKLLFDPEVFQYLDYTDQENGMMVVHVEETEAGSIALYVASETAVPIEGKRMVALQFQAGNVQQTQTGAFQIAQAFAGLAPSGDQIPAVANAIQVTVTRKGIPGDVNFDGVVDVADLALVSYHYRSQEGQPGWERARDCDVTGPNRLPDGIVDILDIVFVAAGLLDQP